MKSSDSGYATTFTGEHFDVFAPDPRHVNIVDIAHALSNLCRFGGHTRYHYSVAQHSVLMALYCRDNGNPNHAFAALMHDAAEAYIGDWVRYLKSRVWMDTSGIGQFPIATVEARVETAIQQALGYTVDKQTAKAVKKLDMRMLADEKAEFFAGCEPWAELHGVEPIEVFIEQWTPDDAKNLFLKLYAELHPNRSKKPT